MRQSRQCPKPILQVVSACFSYLLLRFVTFPLAFLPYRTLHKLGRFLGTCATFLFPKFRKRAESNLALCPAFKLSNSEIRRLAKESIESLLITLLEYPKLAREKNIGNIATCLNPEQANILMARGKGVIFFCGHQANWELLFLEGTSRMPGVAIGRPIKNHYLYTWIQSIREKFGGKMIPPQNAIKEGLRALKHGSFLGIVGDQGMPDSGYSSPFLGRSAWTSPIPALIAYKTNTPILVATTIRKNGTYEITYSDPIFPDQTAPKEAEVKRLMDQLLASYEKSILAHPEQWLWIHNRWKQQTLDKLHRPFRQDSIAFFFPEDETLLKEIPQLRTLYPTEHLSLYVPKNLMHQITLDAEIHPYTSLEETLQQDLRYKLIVNFTQNPIITRHYKKSALTLTSPKTFDAFKSEVIRA